LKHPQTTYEGHESPVRTLYDAVGWILSISAVLINADLDDTNWPDQNNFYLPLLGLFGKWSSVLPPAALLPAMLHVAYWRQEDKHRVILDATTGEDQVIGSSIPNVWQKIPQVENAESPDSPIYSVTPGRRSANKDQDMYFGFRGWDTIRIRQYFFRKHGMVINEPQDHAVHWPGLYEANSGVGRCAETFIYLWLLQQKFAIALPDTA
jgi:hypothetical protein